MKEGVLFVAIGTDIRIWGEGKARNGRDIGAITEDLQICLTKSC